MTPLILCAALAAPLPPAMTRAPTPTPIPLRAGPLWDCLAAAWSECLQPERVPDVRLDDLTRFPDAAAAADMVAWIERHQKWAQANAAFDPHHPAEWWEYQVDLAHAHCCWRFLRDAHGRDPDWTEGGAPGKYHRDDQRANRLADLERLRKKLGACAYGCGAMPAPATATFRPLD